MRQIAAGRSAGAWWLVAAMLLLVWDACESAALAGGRVVQLLPRLGCIATLRAGDALLGGIHAGSLPNHVFIQRCDGLWLSLSQREGEWRTQPIGSRYIPKFLPRRKPFAIPDGRVTVGARNIREAWLTRPTRRYAHGVLGDDIEAGGLAVSDAGGRRVELILPESEVFEDRMARLLDLDGDGRDEIIVVHTYADRGASLAIYGLFGERETERLARLAESPPIGRPQRWLNPAAAGDFDGDGQTEIAWVETPHLEGVLKVARLAGAGETRRLVQIAAARGFSNHAAGSRILQQAVSFDWNGDGRADIVLPDAARKALVAVGLRDGKLVPLARMPIGGRIDSPIVAADLDRDGKGEALLVTRDGRLLSFSPAE
jgi:hypothetical protein